MALRLTTEADPVPARVTDCGLPLALSATVTVAERLPTAVGVKVTLMVQLPLAATELPQVLVWAKSPVLVPPIARLVMVSAAVPVLLRVIVCPELVELRGWLLKVRLPGERLTLGPLPVPLRLTVCWLPDVLLLLSVTTRLAVRVPGAVGVKLTLTVQLLLAASELAQVVVSAKSPALAPENARPLMVRAALPELLNVKAWTELVVPTVWLLKVRLEVDSAAAGALPVPLRLTVCGLPLALSAIPREAVRDPVPAGVNVTLRAQLLPAATELPQVLVTTKSLG